MYKYSSVYTKYNMYIRKYVVDYNNISIKMSELKGNPKRCKGVKEIVNKELLKPPTNDSKMIFSRSLKVNLI